MARIKVDYSINFLLLKLIIEVWLSLVERCGRDAEAAGSNPVTSTKTPRLTFWLSLEFYFKKG